MNLVLRGTTNYLVRARSPGPAQRAVNGKKVAEGELKNVVPARFSATETLDIGADLGFTVSETYLAPNAFSGTIKKVESQSVRQFAFVARTSGRCEETGK